MVKIAAKETKLRLHGVKDYNAKNFTARLRVLLN